MKLISVRPQGGEKLVINPDGQWIQMCVSPRTGARALAHD
jgi:hypothetical protein